MAAPSEEFLERIVGILSKVKVEAERRGYSMLGALVEMARSEAEDELRTNKTSAERQREFRANGSGPPDR